MSGRVWPLSLQAPLPLGRLGSPFGRLGHDDHRTPTILPPMRDTPVAEGGSIGWRMRPVLPLRCSHAVIAGNRSNVSKAAIASESDLVTECDDIRSVAATSGRYERRTTERC